MASAAAIAIAGGGGSSAAKTSTASSVGATSTGTRQAVASTALSATQIYKQASAGVVSIKAVTAQGEDSGTGIVLNDKGLILTNDHVVAGASGLTVAPKGSATVTRSATLVGEEANDDLALIKVDPSGLGLKPLTLDEFQVGPGRRCGLRDRQPVRTQRDAHAWDRLCARAHDLGAERLEDHGCDPNGRCAQSRQLGRPAAQRSGRGDRRELADRERGRERRRLADRVAPASALPSPPTPSRRRSKRSRPARVSPRARARLARCNPKRRAPRPKARSRRTAAARPTGSKAAKWNLAKRARRASEKASSARAKPAVRAKDVS